MKLCIEIYCTDEIAEEIVKFLEKQGFEDDYEIGPGIMEHPDGASAIIHELKEI